MAPIDRSYIAELAGLARGGDGDAFAALYAATVQKQYLFAMCCLGDADLAKDALQEAYVTALRGLSGLVDGRVFIPWLNQINFRVCSRIAERQQLLSHGGAPLPAAPGVPVALPGKKSFPVRQILSLPFSESQAVFLRYAAHLSVRDIAYLTESRKATVRQTLKSGVDRLVRPFGL